MRKALVALCLLLAAGLAAVLVLVTILGPDRILPPTVILESDSRGFRLDDAVLGLVLFTDEPAPGATATLHVFGTPVETVSLTHHRSTFRPVVLPPGTSEIAVEVVRRLGPIPLRRWYALQVHAAAAPPALTLSVPARVWTSRLPVAGTAPPGAWVTLHLDGQPARLQQTGARRGSPEFDEVDTDPTGRFAATVLLPGPGRHELTATLSAPGSPDRPSPSTSAPVVYEAQLPPVPARKLIVTLGRDEISYESLATFERGDPRAEIAGASIGAYTEAVFGRLLFDGGWSLDTRTLPPTSRMRGDRIEVRQSTVGVPVGSLSDGVLLLSFYGGDTANVVHDEIEIRAEGVRIASSQPPPTRVSEGRGYYSPAPREITLSVEMPAAGTGIWRMTPSDILPPLTVGLFHDLLAVVPVLWLLALVRRGFADRPDAHGSALRRDTLLLGALAMFGTMAYLPDALTRPLWGAYDWLPDDLWESSGWRVINHLRDIGLALAYLALFAGFALWARLARGEGEPSQVSADLCGIAARATWWGLLYTLAVEGVRRLYGLSGVVELGITLLPWLAAFLAYAVIACLLIRRLSSTAALVSGRGSGVGAPAAALAAALLWFLARPNEFRFDPLVDQASAPFYDAAFTVSRFLNQLGTLAPLLAMGLVCAALANRGRRLDRKRSIDVAMLLFAGTLAGTGQVWFVVPVSLVLARLLFPRLVLIDGRRAEALARHEGEIRRSKSLLLSREYENARRFAPTGSWFGLIALKKEDQQKKRDYTPLEATLPDGDKIPLADLAFALGPYRDAAANGLRALRVGAWGALAFVLVYAVPSFATVEEGDRFRYLSAISRVLSVGGYWLIAAFFFGYFYEHIRGTSGWRKGAVLATGIALAREPLTILAAQSAADYAAVAINVAQRYAFFLLIGLLAFDMRTFRAAIGRNIEWRVFPLVAGLSVVEAVASVAIAGAGVAASAAFSGQLTNVLGQVATELLPTTSPPLPPARGTPGG